VLTGPDLEDGRSRRSKMKQIAKSKFDKFVLALQLPEGFVGTFGEVPYYSFGAHDSKMSRTYVVENAEKTIRVTFFQYGDGRTEFRRPGRDGWLCFDRTGVSASFYIGDFNGGLDKKTDVNAIFSEQLKRVNASLKYYESAVSVPGMPQGSWTLSPERLVEYKKTLKTGREVTFTPAGFGTGYALCTKKLRRYSQRASAELATFFEVPALWYSTMDCD
jgi:hypothetical protein